MKTFEYVNIDKEQMCRYKSIETSEFETEICSLGELVESTGYRTIFGKQPVVFKEFNTREAKALNKTMNKTQHKRRMKGYRIFYKLALILQHMIVSIGDEVFYEHKNGIYTELVDENHRFNVLKNMYYADVMALYIMLAHYSKEPMNNILEMEVEFDGDLTPIQFDLNECKIIGTDVVEEALWSYDLKVPFKMRGKEVDKIVFGPAPFRNYINTPIKPEDNDTYDMTEVVVGSIYNIPALGDERGAISPMEIEPMHVEDLKKISGLIGDRSCGIDQRVMVSDADDLSIKRDSFLNWWDPDFLI